MSEKILAHWCYSNNLGDALNPYLIEKLTGRKVVYCNYIRPRILHEIRAIIGSLLHFRKYDFRRMTQPVLDRPVILAVGSILSRSHPNYVIWGQGS